MTDDIRRQHLGAYLRDLAADLAAVGHFRGAGSNRIEAAARAFLAGGGAMFEAVISDIKILAGTGASMAAPFVKGAITGAIASATDRALGAGIDRLVNAITGKNGRGT